MVGTMLLDWPCMEIKEREIKLICQILAHFLRPYHFWLHFVDNGCFTAVVQANAYHLGLFSPQTKPVSKRIEQTHVCAQSQSSAVYHDVIIAMTTVRMRDWIPWESFGRVPSPCPPSFDPCRLWTVAWLIWNRRLEATGHKINRKFLKNCLQFLVVRNDCCILLFSAVKIWFVTTRDSNKIKDA